MNSNSNPGTRWLGYRLASHSNYNGKWLVVNLAKVITRRRDTDYGSTIVFCRHGY